eukprot:TRINITY_DN68084_c0_g1_i1.p1 TRINITY_DN68084_c0_g1~~TRINITY_DN68084_c0_g1_i1.p1  ORF type:complete len:287 (-),score=49.02 TRINITY_DN68084_c0_g1_i1:98-958(-)
MVFQEESRISWLWPLSRSLSADKKEREKRDSSDSDSDRAFAIAEAMEMGFARELVTDFVAPLRRSTRLWKFQVRRSDDRSEYRLFGDDEAFLMYARARDTGRSVDFFLYDPDTDRELFDADRPAFTLTYEVARSEWVLRQKLPDARQSAKPPALAGEARGAGYEVELAQIRHRRDRVGEGVSYCLEAALAPPASALKAGEADRAAPLLLRTRRPAWNEDLGCLVLDFKGRKVVASAKNFQLAPQGKPQHVACQYGKIGPNSFGLDFRYPLTVIQAFSIAMTTTCWT